MAVFKDTARKYWEKGFSIIPVEGKAPKIAGWQKYRDEKCDEETLESWINQFPEHNIGLICGEASGISALDIDIDLTTKDGQWIFEQLKDLIPYSICRKAGKKAFTSFYARSSLDSWRVDLGKYGLIEFFSGYPGARQIVLPHSIHPDTKVPYVWLDIDLLSINPKHLPEFPEETKAKLLERVKLLGISGGKISKTGRNDSLKRMVWAMLLRRVPREEILAELIKVDSLNTPPLFSDKNESQMRGKTVEQNATTFLDSITASFKRENGEAEPEIHIPDAKGESGFYPRSVLDTYKLCGVDCTDKGTPIQNFDNVLKVLNGCEEFKDSIWFDNFHQKYFTTLQTGKKHEWSDTDTLTLLSYFQRSIRFSRITKKAVEDAAILFGKQHPRNEARDWMETLTWDGHPRINSVFQFAFGSGDSEYVRAASENWWIGMVARIYEPGCKVDNMVVLEGPQGTLKSTALSIIGSPWFCEAHGSVTSKDFYILLQGRLIVEIAELDAFNRAETNTIKKVITCQTDRFRVPYERAAQDFPRSCIFVGTTNDDHYLKDSTGGRRFWPIRIKSIDTSYLKDCRELLFAEAVAKYKAGQKWFVMPKGLTEEIQESRREHDEWEDLIGTYLVGKSEVKLVDVGLKLGIQEDRLDKGVQRRLGKILRWAGWESSIVSIGGRSERRWIPQKVVN